MSRLTGRHQMDGGACVRRVVRKVRSMTAILERNSFLCGFQISRNFERIVDFRVVTHVLKPFLMYADNDNCRLMDKCTPKGSICPKFLSFHRMEASVLTLYLVLVDHLFFVSQDIKSSFLSLG